MQKIVKTAQAGTLESGDIMIIISPRDGTNVVELESAVALQYGDAIRQVIDEVLTAHEILGVYVRATDRGALDCTVRARAMTALARAGVCLKENLLWQN